jgi:hypothetical protein
MCINLISEYWLKTFQDIPPISSDFKYKFADRWVRFHSLPNSKRYAESEEEYSIILKRHNIILNELIRNKCVLLFTVCYSSHKKPRRYNKFLEQQNIFFDKFDPHGKFWRTVPIHELDHDPDNPNYWHIYVSAWNWEIGVFDQIFRLIADNILSDVFLASPDDSWLYHPYDGGGDVIMPSELERDELKAKYKQWLPQEASDL